MKCPDCGELRHPDECVETIYDEPAFYDKRKIITSHDYPPIPLRNMDWSAHFDGDEPGDNGSMMMGHGATRREAIDDLLEIYESQDYDAPDEYNAEGRN